MPSVAGEGALLVDPFSVSSIRDGLKRMMDDDDLRKELVAKGRKNADRFAPETISKMYLKLYKELLSS